MLEPVPSNIHKFDIQVASHWRDFCSALSTYTLFLCRYLWILIFLIYVIEHSIILNGMSFWISIACPCCKKLTEASAVHVWCMEAVCRFCVFLNKWSNMVKQGTWGSFMDCFGRWMKQQLTCKTTMALKRCILSIFRMYDILTHPYSLIQPSMDLHGPIVWLASFWCLSLQDCIYGA